MCSCSVFLMLSPFFVILLDFACVQKYCNLFKESHPLHPQLCLSSVQEPDGSMSRLIVKNLWVGVQCVYTYTHTHATRPYHITHSTHACRLLAFLTFFPLKTLYSLSSSVLFHRPKSIREERLRAVFEKHGEVTQVSEGHPCHAFTYSAGYRVD